jgi:hypothetical protein
VDGAPCGYQDLGRTELVAENLELCLPPTICNSETCPASLGTCSPASTSGTCEYKEGYLGMKTLPEAWATWYCSLSGGCLGTLEAATVEIVSSVQTESGLPLCMDDASGHCLGIAAVSPLLGGNSRLAQDDGGAPIREWGLGLTPASGLCYELKGEEGQTALVALTDRCAGYCACDDPNRQNFEECGNCLLSGAQEPDTVTPGCPCVGELPPLGSEGEACPTEQTCDWCMSNSHPHFDLDVDTFNHLCGSAATMGSCRLAEVKPVPCMEPVKWPCDAGSWFCFEASASGRIPGTWCCK